MIRVGDYLTPRMVINAIMICNGNYYNLPALLLLACHNRYHHIVQQYTDIKKKEIIKDEEDQEDFDRDVEMMNRVGLDMDRVTDKELPNNNTNDGRAGWGDWNMAVSSSDIHFVPKMKEFRLLMRQSFIKDRNIKPENIEHMLDQLSLFHYLIILLGSQSQLDDMCEQCYYKIINSRHDVMSFLQYLQKASIRDFFEHFNNLYHDFGGMQSLKSHTLLQFLVGLQVVYGGKVDTKQLLHFPELSAKKYRVALNGWGLYCGVGGDIHGKLKT